MNLENTVALITGAAGGIGREVSTQLALAGAALALTDLDSSSLTNVAQELQHKGARVLHRAFDGASPPDLRAFAETVEGELGAISVLANCAGIFRIAPLEEISDDDWDAMLRANLTTVFTTCRVLAPRMKARGTGSIINFASTAGEEGSFRPAAHYAAAKGGVIAFSKSLAREVSPFGVRVNVVSPGPIDTPMLGADTPEKQAAAGARTLLGRIGTPRDIADAVLFLASEQSGFVTGHVLRVNGGSLI